MTEPGSPYFVYHAEGGAHALTAPVTDAHSTLSFIMIDAENFNLEHQAKDRAS